MIDSQWQMIHGSYIFGGLFAYAAGITPEELLGQAGSKHPVFSTTLDDALAPDLYNQGVSVLRAGVSGGWTFCINPLSPHLLHNGFLERISSRGEVFAFYWDINALEQFGYARRGKTEASFDPLMGAGRQLATGTFLDRVGDLELDRSSLAAVFETCANATAFTISTHEIQKPLPSVYLEA